MPGPISQNDASSPKISWFQIPFNTLVPNISFFLRFLRDATDFGNKIFSNRLTCNSASFGEKDSANEHKLAY